MSKFFFFYLILKEKKVGHRTKKYDELSTCISVLLATLWLLMGLMGNRKRGLVDRNGPITVAVIVRLFRARRPFWAALSKTFLRRICRVEVPRLPSPLFSRLPRRYRLAARPHL